MPEETSVGTGGGAKEEPYGWYVGIGSGDQRPLTELWQGTGGGNAERIFLNVVIAPPTGLTATALGEDAVRLEHDDNSQSPSSYTLYWKAGSTMGGDKANADGSIDIGLSALYDHTGRTDGVEYFYLITATRGGEESTESAEVSGVTTLIKPVLTSAIKGAGNPYTTADLIFTDGGSASETEIRVYFSTTSGVAGFVLEKTLPANDTSETITGLTDDEQYWCKLVNYNAAYGESADSAFVATFTTDRSGITLPPEWKSGFPKDNPSDDDSLLGEWIPASDSDTTQVKFNIGSDFDPDTAGTELQDSSDNSFDHGGLSIGQEVFYYIRGRHSTSDGPWTTVRSATVAEQQPGVPTIDDAVFNYGSMEVTLSWSAGSPDNADTYRIQSNRGACGSGWEGWVGVAPPTDPASPAILNVVEAYTYKFRIRAENTGGDSAYSSESSDVLTAQAPGNPTSLVAVTGGNPETEIDLTWVDSTGSLDEIEVWRATTEFGSYSLQDTVASGVQEWTDDVGSDETWWYKVLGTALCGLSDSGYSNADDATTDAAAPGAGPTDITVVPKQGTDNVVTINWTPPSGATDHDVYVSLSPMGADPTSGGTAVGGFTENGPIDVNVASLLGATGDDQVYCNIRGTNSGGAGTWGNEESGYTHRQAPGLSVSPDYANCPTSFDVTLNFTHTNSDGDSRNTTIEWRRKVSGVWGSYTTKAGGSASHIDTGRTNTTEAYEARYQGESATSGARTVIGCGD